jgi:PAS domain S-box-containing protein
MVKIKEIRSYIFADDENLTLEHRLFLSSVTFGIMISLLGSIVAVFVATSAIAVYITLILASFLFIVYYFVRFKKIVKPFILPIVVLSFIGISTIWVFGGGINGSNLMLGFVVLILSLIIVPEHNKKYVISLFLLLVVTIYLIQFYRPDLIVDFTSETKRWIDSIITATYSSLFIYLILNYLLKYYTIERNRAEESEKKYRFIVNTSGEGIGFVNADENFEITNPAAERIFGVGPGGLTGKNLKEFLSDEQYNYILNQTAIRKEGQSSNYEFELTRLDGQKRNILITAVPQFDDKNNFIGTHGIFRDFTDHKEAELALRENQQKLNTVLAEANRFSEIMDNLPSYIYIKNINHEYVYANQLTLKLFNRTKGTLKGSKDSDFFPHETVMELWNIDNQVFEKGIVSTKEVTILINDKNTYFWEVKYPTYNEKGEIDGLCGISADISRLKEAEEALSESEKRLVQLNIDKDRFISILAHDLKSPFNTLLGLSEELTENFLQYGIKDIEYMATSIHQATKNTYNLLEDILLWARAQQDRIPFKPQTLDLENTCGVILEAFKQTAEAKNIRINCLKTIKIEVFADIDMLKTILRNLISNAIKFTNRDGQITISAIKTDSVITISVADNGTGITSDNIAKLFDITQLITTPGTDKERGTGLGLLLCKEFVEKHKGEIWVESEPGKGSVFKFALPVTDN